MVTVVGVRPGEEVKADAGIGARPDELAVAAWAIGARAAAPAPTRKYRPAAPTSPRPAASQNNGHGRSESPKVEMAPRQSEIPMEGDFKDF